MYCIRLNKNEYFSQIHKNHTDRALLSPTGNSGGAGSGSDSRGTSSNGAGLPSGLSALHRDTKVINGKNDRL